MGSRSVPCQVRRLSGGHGRRWPPPSRYTRSCSGRYYGGIELGGNVDSKKQQVHSKKQQVQAMEMAPAGCPALLTVRRCGHPRSWLSVAQ